VNFQNKKTHPISFGCKEVSPEKKTD